MIEMGLVVLVLAVALGILILLRSIKNFAINAAIGLVILFVANNLADLNIGYSWIVILICAIGGALGAILVILLHFLGIYI